MTSVSVWLENGIAARLQHAAQFLVVLDDAVVHQRDAGRAVGFGGRGVRAVAEMRVRVVHGRSPVRGPAVGDAGRALQMLGIDLRLQLGHTRRAACARCRPPVGLLPMLASCTATPQES